MGNPLLNIVGNLILEYFGESTQAMSPYGYPELAELPCVQALRRKQGAVVLWIGGRETGKTIGSYRLSEIVARPTYAVSPEQKPPPWVEELKLEQLDKMPPPFSMLVLDDLPVYMGSRDYGDAAVRAVERIIPVVRHRRKLILQFNAQTSSQADRHVLDADLVFLKVSNPLFFETERSAVLRIYKKVMPIFRQMSEFQQKRHCYIVSKDWEGFARIDMPHLK